MRRLLRNDVAIIAVGQLLQQIITMGTGIILARVLGSSGYGLVNLLRTLFTGLMTVAPLGLDLALLKYCGRHADAHQVSVTVNRLRVVAAVMNIAVALGVGVGFGGVLMRDVYRYDQFDTMLLITLAGLPFAADLGAMGAVYKAKGRPGLYALMTVYLQPVIRLVLIGVAVLVWPTVMAIVVINTIQITVSSLAVMLHNRSMAVSDPSRSTGGTGLVPWSEARGVLSESLWMALNLLVYGMMRFVDILMLGYYLPAHEVGEYAALSTISQLVQVYPLAASQTLGPNISRQYHAGDLKGVRRFLDDYIYLATLISGFIFAGIAVFGTELDLVFGKSFHFQQGVSILMPVGYLLSATLAPTGYALSMTGRHRAELGILSFGGLALLLLCRVLIPTFGQNGAATAVATSFLIINVVRFAYVSKVLGFVPGQWRDVLPPVFGLVLASIARTVVAFGFDRSLPALVAACVLYAVLYAAACQGLLFKPGTRDAIARQWRERLQRVRPRWINSR